MSQLSNLAQHIARRPQRIALLQQIAAQGSITQAAKAAGISYKSAWDAIDELNNLAGQPLVERSIGGKGGGGARLSPTGERLVQLYQRLESLQAQLLSAAEQADDLQLLGRLMLRTSARNQLSGQVVAIHPQGRNDLIEITFDAHARLLAQITRDSTELLELAPGKPVVALFKAGSLQLHPADSTIAAADNPLAGQIEQVLDDADGPAEVRISLPSGQTLCALLERSELQRLGLLPGQAVLASIAPAQILLGSPT
ncbi:TOBE domain-containing protein [Aquipseudomonas ullengensis]|uniref:TOBE domain-containing protein n=1 Tax=Aquipseudomonas ullengensis TaxID=2759166 RepID=A0A7W4Q8J3_9GAMM|nr:TOBE domain-containing protein [Pseudomonas ullengensis]MBB2493847.1 TOBE domain-containing protein [Pseudomonas ullengensis]